MNKALIFTVILLILSAASGWNVTHAQRSTEIYIPIGESPGLAGYTKIGTVASVNSQANRFVLTDSLSQEHPVVITDSTRIWLDRSKMKKRNLVGSPEDLEPGRLAEVKFYLAPDSTYLQAAEWIKIQVEPSQ
ncbi:MAG: hypothetical protein R3211_07120 [Balneolaceae bacterium]|nr:hypothetical protein [Balneolaceae bacterium]